MKICIYMTLFQLGGIDSYWQHIMRRRTDISWQIYTNTGAKIPQSMQNLSSKSIHGIHWKKPWATCKALLKYLNEETPNALVLNGTLAEILIFPLLPLLKWRGIKIISIYHSSNIYQKPRKDFVNRLILSVLGWFHDRNFFVSGAVAKYWWLRGVINPLPIQVRRRSLPELKNTIESGDHALHKKSLKVGFVGRLSYEKGPDQFCEVFKKIRMKHQDLPIEAVVYGDGPMLEALKESVAGIEGITFAGWVNQMTSELEKVDLLLITSRTEGFPMVVIECLENGVPILGYRVGGVDEALGPTLANEYLVPLLNQEMLIEKVADFCQHYCDRYQNYFDQLNLGSGMGFDARFDQAL